MHVDPPSKANVPAEQAVHDDACASANVPAGHTEQLPSPALDVYVPVLHPEHTEAYGPEYAPTPHAVQVLLPDSEKVPARQPLQFPALVPEYSPAEH